MAGLTSSPFKPPFSRTKPHFLESKLFGLRLYTPNSSNLNSLVSVSHRPISARYGGGRGFFRPAPRDDKRSKKSSSDEDQAIDISSIRSDTVRLIDEQQNMVGIMPKSAAVQMADDAELDLVILSPDADPPVVRLMDYNKYTYELQKKKRDQQKKSAALRMDQKEVKMRYNIEVHDYSVRLKAAQKFLKDGDKVKILVSLRGRENAFRNNAIELIRRFQNDIGELAVEESKSFKEKIMTMVLVPNKDVVQKEKEPPKKKESSTLTETTEKESETTEKESETVMETTEVSAGV